jgi:hypothetical protein
MGVFKKIVLTLWASGAILVHAEQGKRDNNTTPHRKPKHQRQKGNTR